MQVKVIIGTIAFMLTMVVLGYAALREPARMQAFSAAFNGRSIESGAQLYRDNCATCHGVYGEAKECYAAGSGEPIGCQGRPLNSVEMVCGDRPARLELLDWKSTKRAFIEQTIAGGRPGTVMPTWSAQFGGPMRDDQIFDIASYVLNWGEDVAFCSQPIVTYDWPDSVEDFLALEEIADGDAANGEELYMVTYTCQGCHGTLDDSGSAVLGPWLGNIAEDGATRIEGYSADQYLYESILEPDAFIAPDCPTGPCTGPPGIMRSDLASLMGENPQDMADILAYLLGDGG